MANTGEMKDFTYYDRDKKSLHIDDCDWLENMGLRETQWILDGQWFLRPPEHRIFKEWIRE